LPAISPYLFDNATFGSFDELKENFNLRRGVLLPDGRDSLRGIELRLQKQTERGFDVGNLPGGEAFAFKTDRIGAISRRIPFAHRFRIGQDVLCDNGVSPDVGVGPHTAELVHSGIGANRRVILDGHMPGERRSICHDDVIPENAIMRNMHVDHKEVVVADARVSAAAFGAAVDVDVLTKNIVRPDCQVRFLVVKLEILGWNPNHAEWEKPIVASDDCRAFENDVGIENAAIADRDARSDAAEGPNADVLAETSLGMDDGCGMNQFMLPGPQ